MPLKIDLRAQEKLYVGNSTLVVASQERSTLIIDGTLPVVRERDFIHVAQVTTPFGALMRAIQTHYLSPCESTLAAIYKIYFGQADEQPSAVKDAMKCVADGDLYRALRLLRTAGRDI